MKLELTKGISLEVTGDTQISMKDIRQIQNIIDKTDPAPALHATAAKGLKTKKRKYKTRRAKRKFDADQIYNAVHEFITENHVKPTAKEVGKQLKITSTKHKQSIDTHLCKLAQKGRLVREGTRGHSRFNIILRDNLN